ncbi:hypothetical protein SERLADRAFT_374513 [Serpula lacrymans var. lacrymans S7.9]|uniref:Uncharacterized protein n=1 Tax=Serpula lacrymans var. lacrymans (strain S7.9) TaxID=578457 RepID=F8PC41_SERL9|nr:uncharacterized protein SERLADRAFT_374513 [Serpula lacrymans var. lacrymans S7.9]EGO19241.1 hypothetical protein SERLADRAFT_374513 [Serpula lacrymans var. lacrymans S7.9]
MSAGDIDTLSNLWKVSLLKNGLTNGEIPFTDSQDLYRTIDAIPLGGIPWESFSLSYNGDVPEASTHEIDYAPLCKFDADRKCQFKDFMSGDWAWTQADKIAEDPITHGEMVVPIILGSNKTTVSVATGHNEYYPLYVSVGNVHNNVRRAHQNAVALLGFLAIPKNYPEQALLACIVQGWCAHCIALPNNLDGEGKRRSQKYSEALTNVFGLDVLWDKYGIVGDLVPFTNSFPQANIHKLLAPDLLHQVIKGTFKDHLVSWVEDYLMQTHGKGCAEEIMDSIDRRIAAALSFPGLRRFPEGCGFKQWTGNNSKVLMKVYLPAIERHVPPDVTKTFRAYLEFCYLVQRNAHNKTTLTRIQDALDCFHQYCTVFQTTGAVKEPWRRSNRYNALGQMLLTNQRLDKLAALRVDFIECGMLSGNIMSPQAAVEGGVNINTGDLESGPVLGPPTVAHQHLHDSDAPCAANIILSNCPAGSLNAKILVFHSATAMFYAPSDESGLRGMHQETICASPSWWRGPSRHDCVFVERDWDAGIGLHWFSKVQEEPNNLIGIWMVRPDFNEGLSPTTEVIHLDCILRATHLLPVFGDDSIPQQILFHNSLDAFASFYVNKFIDHHAFGLAS